MSLKTLPYFSYRSGILPLEMERTLSRMSGPKLLFVLAAQANLPVLTQAPRFMAHEEAWDKGSLDAWVPAGGHCPSPTWLWAPLWLQVDSQHFLQILTNAVIIKINRKVNFLFPTLQVHSEPWLPSKV